MAKSRLYSRISDGVHVVVRVRCFRPRLCRRCSQHQCRNEVLGKLPRQSEAMEHGGAEYDRHATRADANAFEGQLLSWLVGFFNLSLDSYPPEFPKPNNSADRVVGKCSAHRKEHHLAFLRETCRDVSQRDRGTTSGLWHCCSQCGNLGRLADTRPSALHDVPLHTPSSQWEDIYDVNVDVQVTSPSSCEST